MGLKEHLHVRGLTGYWEVPSHPRNLGHGYLKPVYGGMSAATWSGGSGDLILYPAALTGGGEETHESPIILMHLAVDGINTSNVFRL